MREIQIENKVVGMNHPTYFIADVGANHDGNLERAKDLIYLCAGAGADAAKFQHFTADTIVSDKGFKSLDRQQSHQSRWKKSVFNVYQDASIDQDWTPVLKETCNKAGIAFLTSPYSYELVDKVDDFLSAYKIGSGDITWLGIVDYIASKNKPVLLATGASTIDEVEMAMSTLLNHTNDVVLMQCNTNYTASLENFKYINLNVLKEYGRKYPNTILGLSDHTPGHATVLGAVTLGARVIEKHFTDDTTREGPDHKFSMDFNTWKDMVFRTRELENSLGLEIKKVEDNEAETVVLQRRSIRLKKDLAAGDMVREDDLEFLRPCPEDALPPYKLEKILDKELVENIKSGDYIKWTNIK
ncbi:N-acetylneuraminate synthase [Candidatus Thioglobus autotrophicus]|jgi:sialic acid synthase SpsE|uniref:N-acetylneuraminate synthase n=1 Tax=Candidatus Thioglobus autotrophicus TaxID=1705394 RepID=A0A0M5LEE7_9GAMM|nr:N-acetylneuraminate synthase family protein [Candidatus Thioglobus autotrophicus]ALE52153.1 N-acetylneuraminate synthase [Candidatus Thioglobus autotrophicus]